MDTITTGHGMTFVSELARLDVNDRPFRRATARGELVRVHRGAYIDAEEWERLDRYERYRRHVLAVSLASRGRPVLTHESAAAVWGMPTLGRRGEVVHVLTTPAAGTRTENGVRRHAMRVADEDVIEAECVRFTSLRRTLFDLMREAPFASATASLDWALRHDPRKPKPTMSREVLAAYVDGIGPTRGARRISRVLDFADERSESAGESLSRVAIAELGFPAPELQVEIRDAEGLAGRVDFYWPRERLVGEFDGGLKYDASALGRPDSLLEEKVREDRIRRTGNGVARWDWNTAWTGTALYRRLTEAGLPSLLRSPEPGPIRSLGAGVSARISRYGPD